MRVIKSKTLRAVEPHTKYMGCTFYLEGPHCLDDCVFDNCSFRGELHYEEDPYYRKYPKVYNCNFPENVICEFTNDGLLNDRDRDKVLANFATKIIIIPKEVHKLSILCDLPKIKTIDLSAYESYSEIPADWFERFPTLEEVILSKDIPLAFSSNGNLRMLCQNTEDENGHTVLGGYVLSRKPLLNEKIVQDACSAANKWKSRKPAP